MLVRGLFLACKNGTFAIIPALCCVEEKADKDQTAKDASANRTVDVTDAGPFGKTRGAQHAAVKSIVRV